MELIIDECIAESTRLVLKEAGFKFSMSKNFYIQELKMKRYLNIVLIKKYQ